VVCCICRLLIKTGPYAIVKHPLYVGSGIYSPEEEKLLSGIFGVEWENYSKKDKFPWI
jgi:hypothetical protein